MHIWNFMFSNVDYLHLESNCSLLVTHQWQITAMHVFLTWYEGCRAHSAPFSSTTPSWIRSVPKTSTCPRHKPQNSGRSASSTQNMSITESEVSHCSSSLVVNSIDTELFRTNAEQRQNNTKHYSGNVVGRSTWTCFASSMLCKHTLTNSYMWSRDKSHKSSKDIFVDSSMSSQFYNSTFRIKMNKSFHGRKRWININGL